MINNLLPGRHTLIALLTALFVLHTSDSAAASVQPGYEFTGMPRAEFLTGDLRAYIGHKFWVRRPFQGQIAIPLFCDSSKAPTTRDCPHEKFSVSSDEPFTIEDAVVANPEPGLSWFKIHFDNSKKAAYLSLSDFTEHRYNEARVSRVLSDIDHALANAGWIFDDYPPRVLNQRRAQFEAGNDPGRMQQKLESERILRVKLLYIGMTAQQVRNSGWGSPNSTTTTLLGGRRLEKWDYGSVAHLYFDGDRLYRIETTGR